MFYAVIWICYLILASLALIGLKGITLNKNQYLLLSSIVAITLSLIVYEFGPEYSPDYDMFEDWYGRSKLEVFGESWVSLKDPAFYFMSRFFNWLGLSYDYMNFFFCLISISSLMFLLRSEKFRRYIFVILLVYYSRFYFVHDFTQVRFSVAIILSTIGYFLFSEDKYIKAFLLIIVAALFHISAVFCVIPLLCRLLPRKSLSMKIILVLLLSFIFLGLLVNPDVIINFFQSIPIVYNRLLPYLNGAYGVKATRIITTYFMLKFVILILVSTVLIVRKKDWEKEYIYLVYTVCISIILSVAFRSNDAIALRFVEYFAIFDILFFIESFYFLNKNYLYKKIGMDVFGFGTILLSIIWVLSSIKLFKG
ncbi:EpsG family protein [Tatumella citrea]|uniref:EpsG family protein n=1 Tax=Tatumella citrea TaxID=53336 RepID=A0A1Y0LG90_TATCI|nr:EpsG family protein [Tatumella citrea]ARU93084.1 hypothetical protein A7K98_04280 [Tatumella citrea]ARU97122.1 hypothetical protein A7K99_04280 [Tatumella citrea]